MEAVNTTNAAWGVASLPFAGEIESGDSYVVKHYDTRVLVAVIDALGHGQDAAYAARAATEALERYGNEALDSLFRRCDALMRETRGAAISVALFDTQKWTLTWLGVGNVIGALVRANVASKPRVKRLIVHGGVVGSQLPELQPSIVQVIPGDTLILATDGVNSDFTESLPATLGPQPLADQLLQGYATHKDDALVLVFPLGAVANY